MARLGFLIVLLTACGGSGAKQPQPTTPQNHAPAQTAAPSDREPDESQAAREASEASQAAEAARAKVAALMHELDELDGRVSLAVNAVTDAQNAADQKAASERLRQLQHEQAALKARITEAKAEAERAERRKGVKVSNECVDNPLAKSCQ